MRQITKKQITLRIPIETLEAAKAEAVERGIPQSEVLRSLWELRARLRSLPDGQRLAIIDADTGRVVEFVDILAPKQRRPRHVDAEQRPVPAV